MEPNQSQISTGRINNGAYVDTNAGIINNNFYNESINGWARARECHRLFKTTNYEAHKNFNPQPHPGTCEWVLQNLQFRNWQQTDRPSLLWFSADAGRGKSVLTRLLVDSECLAEGQICYFFFGDSTEQNNLAAALCAVLHQLFCEQPHLLSYAVNLWEQNGDHIRDESVTMWRILCAATSDPTCHPVIGVFDAVDECIEQDRGRLLDLFFQLLSQSSPSRSSEKLKLFVTSRRDEIIERFFQRQSSVEVYFRLHSQKSGDHNMDEEIHNDIMLVIRDRVDEFGNEFSLSDKSRDQLDQDLRQIEYRTFLGLDLVLQQARVDYQNSFCPSEIRVQQLPSSLEDMYEQILSRITGGQKNSTKSTTCITRSESASDDKKSITHTSSSLL